MKPKHVILLCKLVFGRYNQYCFEPGNGAIEPEELKVVMAQCVEESNLHLGAEALEDLTMALFEEADSDGTGVITFEELRRVLEKHPDVLNNMSLR